jgi:hypothetical protein
MLGAVATSRGQFDLQLRHARFAIAELDAGQPSDAWILTQNMTNVAVRADIQSPEDIAMLKLRTESVVWNEDIAGRRCDILDALGWEAALAGNHLEASRYFQAAANTASGDAERVIAIVSRATLEFGLGQEIGPRQELVHALKLARTIDWERSPSDRRFTLLFLSAALARVASDDAREILNRFRNLESTVSLRCHARYDPCVRALEHFTEGCVSRYEGRRDAAITCLTEAYATYLCVGFLRYATWAAIELAELHAGDAFAAFARRQAERWPKSWFARRVAALPA